MTAREITNRTLVVVGFVLAVTLLLFWFSVMGALASRLTDAVLGY